MFYFRRPRLLGRLARISQRLLRRVLLRVRHHQLRKTVFPDARRQLMAATSAGSQHGRSVGRLLLRKGLSLGLLAPLLPTLFAPEVKEVLPRNDEHLLPHPPPLWDLHHLEAVGKVDPETRTKGSQGLKVPDQIGTPRQQIKSYLSTKNCNNEDLIFEVLLNDILSILDVIVIALAYLGALFQLLIPDTNLHSPEDLFLTVE